MSAPAQRPSQKVRVCVFCESWESGGIEAFLTNVICSMNRDGLVIDIVAARLGQSVFSAPMKERGVSFFQLSGSTRRVGENRRLFQKLVEKRRYDVFHLNAYQALSLTYLCTAKEAGVLVRIAHSHNTALRKSITRSLKLALHHWARKRYANDMTCRWACSKAAAEFLFGETGSWHFIPNGIDISRFRFDPEGREKVRNEMGLDGRLVIGNVGRLCYQKNQGFLLEVLGEVRKLNPESVLLLIGEGEDKSRLEEKAKTLGIEGNIIFYGTTDKVEQFYWAMDVFVFPSFFEGLGIAAIEAQASGVPVVCSEHIPKEALVTGQVTQLSLSAGARTWAEAVQQAKAVSDRTAAAGEISAAGYAVETVAARIREAWMG